MCPRPAAFVIPSYKRGWMLVLSPYQKLTKTWFCVSLGSGLSSWIGYRFSLSAPLAWLDGPRATRKPRK